MILRIFRDNQVFAFLITLLSALAIWFYNVLVAPHAVYVEDFHSPMSLFNVFPALKAIDRLPYLTAGINVMLTFICGIYLMFIAIKHQIIQMRSSITMFLFIVLTSAFFQQNHGLSYPLISLFFLLLVIDVLFASLERKTMTFRFFDSAMIISTLSMINLYFIFFSVFILFVWLQFRTRYWREAVLILLGLCLPYLLMFVFFYISGIETALWFDGGLKNLVRERPVFEPKLSLIALTVFTGILFILSSIKMLREFVKMKIIVRRYSLTFLFLFVLIVFIALFYPQVETDILFFLSVSLSFLFGYYFSYCKPGFFNQLLFILFIAFNLAALLF